RGVSACRGGRVVQRRQHGHLPRQPVVRGAPAPRQVDHRARDEPARLRQPRGSAHRARGPGHPRRRAPHARGETALPPPGPPRARGLHVRDRRQRDSDEPGRPARQLSHVLRAAGVRRGAARPRVELGAAVGVDRRPGEVGPAPRSGPDDVVAPVAVPGRRRLRCGG
ncbi:hypothetical protein OY671_011175, partial [Metschnikowia pulcherrima]